MARKIYGNFTPDAAKALKNSDRITCRIAPSGDIYVATNYAGFKMCAPEYAAVVQPVTCCEAGNWTYINGTKREDGPIDENDAILKFFADAADNAAEAEPLERCPLQYTVPKVGTVAAYYSGSKDFVALFNTKFTGAFAPGAVLRTPATLRPAAVYSDGAMVGLIMPVRSDEKIDRSVKAYFNAPTEQVFQDSSEADKLREELARLQNKLNQAEAEANELRELAQQQAHKIEAMQAAEASKPQGAAVEPKTAAEMIAARWANVEGVTVTVKGAQTAAPVVWLSGSTKPHTKEIEAAGGHWSHKKNAYYFRVA